MPQSIFRDFYLSISNFHFIFPFFSIDTCLDDQLRIKLQTINRLSFFHFFPFSILRKSAKEKHFSNCGAKYVRIEKHVEIIKKKIVYGWIQDFFSFISVFHSIWRIIKRKCCLDWIVQFIQYEFISILLCSVWKTILISQTDMTGQKIKDKKGRKWTQI